MADATKHFPINGGAFISDLFSIIKTRRTVAFAYGLMLAFLLFTIFLAFNPSPNPSAPWFTNFFTAGSSHSAVASSDSYKSQFSSFFSHFFSNDSSQQQEQYQLVRNVTSSLPTQANTTGSTNTGSESPVIGKELPIVENSNITLPSSNNTTSQNPITSSEQPVAVLHANQIASVPVGNKQSPNTSNQTQSRSDSAKVQSFNSNQTSIRAPNASNQTHSRSGSAEVQTLESNQISIPTPNAPVPVNQSTSSQANSPGNGEKSVVEKGVGANYTIAASLSKKQGNGTKQSNGRDSGASAKQGVENLMQSLMNCDLFDGNWVRDVSYPLYKARSCPLIDKQFNCILN
ncbi:hypothetical protein SLEP1_g35237 [Rubroshorea leprosula]|uniref:Trichome birefringence-like N-terminal domain-containing protein n=1 Tax=Rubroshorea leprosula TaxID=152421 RepID=A0AAV5KML2_9ROSI|nr:hypothetical protein SLEP1_g35237 [Rubroshorea leprosula]